MFCRNCGQNLPDSSAFCNGCGTPQAEGAPNAAPPYQQQPQYQYYAPYRPAEPDVPNAGFNILSFFFPLIGLILYIVWEKDYPIRAKAIGKWALISVCVAAGIGLLSLLLMVIAFGALAFY